jgi:hypothetical protein
MEGACHVAFVLLPSALVPCWLLDGLPHQDFMCVEQPIFDRIQCWWELIVMIIVDLRDTWVYIGMACLKNEDKWTYTSMGELCMLAFQINLHERGVQIIRSEKLRVERNPHSHQRNWLGWPTSGLCSGEMCYIVGRHVGYPNRRSVIFLSSCRQML